MHALLASKNDISTLQYIEVRNDCDWAFLVSNERCELFVEHGFPPSRE